MKVVRKTKRCRDGVMNNFAPWFMHLLVLFLFVTCHPYKVDLLLLLRTVKPQKVYVF